MKPLMNKILLSTVDKDAGEKGTPFPRIPGPSPEDKVCIVGAGPAGLHMAVELRRRNYNNIVILEKSNRVGGKCYDVHYQGRVNALGAMFATEEYFDNFIPLAKYYNDVNLLMITEALIHIQSSNQYYLKTVTN